MTDQISFGKRLKSSQWFVLLLHQVEDVQSWLPDSCATSWFSMCQMLRKKHWQASLRVFWEASWPKNILERQYAKLVLDLPSLLRLISTHRLQRTCFQSQPSSTTPLTFVTSQKCSKVFSWPNPFQSKTTIPSQDFGCMKLQESSLIGYAPQKTSISSKTLQLRSSIRNSRSNGLIKINCLNKQQMDCSQSFSKLIVITDFMSWLKRSPNSFLYFKTN